MASTAHLTQTEKSQLDEFTKWLNSLRLRAKSAGVSVEPLTEMERLWINQPCLWWSGAR